MNALPTPDIIKDDYETTDSRTLPQDHVRAQREQHIGAGVGAALAMAAVLIACNVETPAILKWAGLTGLFVFGMTHWIRGGGWLDEVRASHRWRKREREHYAIVQRHKDNLILTEQERDAEVASNIEKDEIIVSLRHELQRAVHEASVYRVRVSEIQAAYNDSHIALTRTVPDSEKDEALTCITHWAQMGEYPTRKVMMQNGMTRRAHERAMFHLSRAQILAMGEPFNGAIARNMLDTYFASPLPQDWDTEDATSSAGRDGTGRVPAQEGK